MILIKNLSKSVINKTLFENITFKVTNGQKVGFVGPNGAGKTTLLKIIAGFEDADNGSVQTSGSIIGYLPQKIDLDANTIIYDYMYESLNNDWEEYKIKVSLAKVGLGKVDSTRNIATLSGGQKMKLGLAKILLTEPSVIILDEPTNNLDSKSMYWLEKFVKGFDGEVLLVSHDRTFLNNTIDKIIELDSFKHTINEYGGNYDYYIAERQRRQENILADYKIQQRKEKQMNDWIVLKQQQLKYHPSNKVARQLQAMKTRRDREITNNKIDKPQEYKGFNINSLGNNLHKKKSVFVVENFEISELINCNELYVYASDRINFTGPNGAGKTTFIRSIIGLNKSYSGDIEIGNNIKIGYFSQEHEILNPDRTVMDNLIDLTSIEAETKARFILGSYLFTKEKAFSPVKMLSEGEKARLIFAILITQKNDFLLLDEPTNHLDLESREILEEALNNYEGGFIVVSHDRYFLKNIGVNKMLKIKNKQIL